MRRSIALLLFALGCGGPRVVAEPVPPAPPPPEFDPTYRPPTMLWWQGAAPHCSIGAFRERTLSWGSVYWCQVPNHPVDANLQNDLGRLARCLYESMTTFQEEPHPGALGAFLARAKDAGLAPMVCGGVRRDLQVRTYNGLPVLWERRFDRQSVVAEETMAEIFYRLSCEDCLVAAKIRVQLVQ